MGDVEGDFFYDFLGMVLLAGPPPPLPNEREQWTCALAKFRQDETIVALQSVPPGSGTPLGGGLKRGASVARMSVAQRSCGSPRAVDVVTPGGALQAKAAPRGGDRPACVGRGRPAHLLPASPRLGVCPSHANTSTQY